LNEAEFNPLSPAILGGPSSSGGGAGSGAGALEKSRNGRQLLDQESLASLLVLLFIDEPRMNMTKLHRVVRNLCIHSPTRAWVIKALLCILEKVSGKQQDSYNNNANNNTQLAIQDSETKRHSKQSNASSSKSTPATAAAPAIVINAPTTLVCQPSWLTMSIDGPFGSKTNVFTIIKPIHKKSTSQSKLTTTSPATNNDSTPPPSNNFSSTISINTQACPAIFKQILEILSTLARAANFNFFPRNPFPSKSSGHSHHHQHHSNPSKSHFWDIIVKLDQSKNKSSKLSSSSSALTPITSQKASASGGDPAAGSGGMYEFDNDMDFSVENSPLARLMSMLDYPVLKNNAHLMDKMFTCLSYASAGIPIIESAKAAANAAASSSIGSGIALNRGGRSFFASSLSSTNSANSNTDGWINFTPNQPQIDSKLPKGPLNDNEPLPPPTPSVDNEEVLSKQIELVVNVLKNKLCTQEGLQQAYTLLNNLSKINGATRNMIIRHLLKGTRELGLAVCKEIEVLHEEAIKYNATTTTLTSQQQPQQQQQQPTTSTNAAAAATTTQAWSAAATSATTHGEDMDTAVATNSHQPNSIMAAYSMIPPSTSSRNTTTQQNLIDSYSNLVISSPKTKQTGELQLPSMSILVEKNSNQKFFVRLIRLIINLRETIEKEAKKKKNQLAAAAAAIATSAAAAATDTAPAVASSNIAVIPQINDNVATTATTTTPSITSTTTSQPTEDAEIDDTVTPKPESKNESSSSASTSSTTTTFPELPRLSSELDLDILWNKLSSCLTILKSLSDPYAVLILQPTVEAFFYVHATRKDKDESKKREKETKETQLSHLDQESGPMSPGTGPHASSTSSSSSSLSAAAATSMKNAALAMAIGGSNNSTLIHGMIGAQQSQQSLKQQEDEIAAIINSISNETSPDTKRFLEFALTHRTVLNHILRQTSNNLSEEPYSVLVDFTRLHTHILDFDVKRRYFRQELDKLKDSIRGDDLAVHVRRTHVFDDSYRELNRRSPDDWKHRFYIAFEGEEGQDAGGLLREWYMIISKEIFNPDYALFMINPGDRVTYMPNPSSHFNSNHLSYFRFIGHIIAKAIFDNKFLDCYFTRAFYKHILGVPVKYTDMESVDNEFYKNLVSILESDIDTLGVDLYFSIDINEFGVTQSRDLKPNGKNIKVANELKTEYVRLVCQEKMIGSIRQQVSAFLQGFYEIIPKSLISIFNEQELELLISGLPEIDLEDLRRNTEYHKYTTNSLQIQWFWRALKSFDKEDQAKFLQFVTGTSKVPLQGFAKLEGMNGPQKFQIHRDDRDTSRLPCAHTCFNQLDLPAYENYEKLRTMMLMAIRECSTGFGLA
jgi:E3 ubiquitin-protein ligase HUWE1